MIEDDPIDSCRFRARARGQGNEQIAECRLLLQITRIDEADLCDVRRDACSFCVRSYTPSPNDLNPVVASLLHGLARQIIERGGTKGCSAEQAEILQLRAEEYLDHAPDEVDAPYRPLRSTLTCHHRGAPIGFRVVRLDGQVGRVVVSRCHHPDHRETTEAECSRCLDWTDRPGLDPFGRLLPIPELRCGPEVRTWSVGVTTSLRRRPTLEWTLDGLARAGWDRPRLFVDGPVTIPHRHAECPVTYREPRIGAWPNFYLSLAELLMRDPEADAYLMVQDDVDFFDGVKLREYLESVLWPGDSPGPVSLYSCQLDARPAAGWTRHEHPWFLGAHAFIFPGDLARRFLADPVVMAHRRTGSYNGLANVDTVVGEWAFRDGSPISFPTPSLCRHVGHASTLWPGAKIEGNRKEGPFAGDLDARTPAAPSRRGSFDESAFPCVEGGEEAYREAVARGTARMRGRSVVICGLCRDVFRTLPDVATRVERLGAMFGDYRAVFYENDSVDGTAAFLRHWTEANPSIRSISERRGVKRFANVVSLERAAHLAACRNIYREFILEHFGDFDHAIVVDMDIEGGWSFDGIAHTFGQDDWDFVGSNGLITGPLGPGRPIYYDTWAYRTHPPDLSPTESLTVRRGEPLRPVLSCFGGLGVYRMACLEAPYEGGDCEHVTLHRNMRESGFDRLFLNPSQVVLYDRKA